MSDVPLPHVPIETVNCTIPQTIIVQQPMAYVMAPKIAPDYKSYTEFCAHCNKNVQTEVDYTAGTCFCAYLVLGLFCCCICLFCLCCNSSKDAHHYCPNCRRELSFKKR